MGNRILRFDCSRQGENAVQRNFLALDNGFCGGYIPVTSSEGISAIPNHWQKLRSLTSQQRRALVLVCLLLPATALALRLFGLQRVQRWLERRARVPRPAAGPALTAESWAWLVRTAARRGLWPANCLPQSLVLWWMLQRNGFPARVCIGVARNDSVLVAHAWVEHEGVVLNDSADVAQRYARFDGNLLTAHFHAE